MSDITWTNTKVRLGELVPWSRNPKTISKVHAKRLLEYWDKLGQFQSIAVSESGDVYDGHQRLSVLLAAHGKDYEVDARQSSRPLTEKEREELVIAAHVGTVGQFDWEQLSNWDAPELIAWGMDDTALKDWKQDVSALSALLESEKQEVDAEPQIDRAAELNEKWQVKTGDLWQIGEHRLLCGDSTISTDVERLMQSEKAGVVITDPPYGMGLDTDFTKMPKTPIAGKAIKYSQVIGDDKPFDINTVFGCDSEEQFWWGGDWYYESLPPYGSWIVWDKRTEDSDKLIGNTFEMCWSKKRHRREFIRHYWKGVVNKDAGDSERYHPTQKPAPVIQFIVEKYTEQDCIVYDPFIGSGTTMVACENLHRKCRAIEISPNYCAVILQRMSDAFPELEIKLL